MHHFKLSFNSWCTIEGMWLSCLKHLHSLFPFALSEALIRLEVWHTVSSNGHVAACSTIIYPRIYVVRSGRLTITHTQKQIAFDVPRTLKGNDESITCIACTDLNAEVLAKTVYLHRRLNVQLSKDKDIIILLDKYYVQCYGTMPAKTQQ